MAFLMAAVVLTIGAMIACSRYSHHPLFMKFSMESPEKSLMYIHNFIEPHGLYTFFKKYVNMSDVANSIVDSDILSLSENRGTSITYLTEVKCGGQAGIILEIIVQQLAGYLATGKFAGCYMFLKDISRRTGFCGIDCIKNEGDIAYVGFRFLDDKLGIDLTSKMVNRSGYGQVAELDNLVE